MNNEEYGNLFQKATQLFYQQDYERAENICNQLIKINSKQSDVYNLLSIVKDKQSNLELSIAAPFLVRDIRPDGLTRSFVLGLQYQYSF